MLHIHLRAGRTAGQHVASINRQDPAADTFDPAKPWLLLRTDGRVSNFPSQAAAREEAVKLWAPCSFTRN